MTAIQWNILPGHETPGRSVWRAFGAGVAACLFLSGGAPRDDEKKRATEPLGEVGQPLAFGLDMHSFIGRGLLIGPGDNGEILSNFDRFVAVQGVIAVPRTIADLKAIHEIVVRDYALAKEAEEELDDEYDTLKDEIEKIEEELEENHDEALLSRYLALEDEADPVKDRRDLLRDYLRFEKPLLKLLDRAAEDPGNERLRSEACNVALRAMYSLFSTQLMDERDGKTINIGIDGALRVVQQVICRAYLNATPFRDGSRRHEPVGAGGAAREAANLVDPGDRSRFLSREELATLSHGEVAALDLSPEDPMWHTHRRMETTPPDTWKEIENWLSAAVSDDLNDKKKFREANPDFIYELHEARAVLFWDKIKTTATSPKVNVTDAFNREWKLKWGEECAVEPITNRLRARLGAKYCDLVYTDTDGGSHLLILCSETEQRMKPGKLMPVTLEDLIVGLQGSEYKFNVKPFIRACGTITEANAGVILKDLSRAALKGNRPEDLIGRTWVSFRESMVEVKHDLINRGGPIANFTEFAAADRALRQSFMISLWLEETDCKEDNYRSVWMKDFAGQKGHQYLEFFHDAGSALGAIGRTGEINQLHTGSRPRDFMWLNPGKTTVFCNSFQTVRPRVWDDVTFADHYSGARHVARISRNDIRDAVRHSKMPDYWQETTVWRLASRRDTIAETFGLTAPDDPAGEAPAITVPLTTRADRNAAARRYRIPVSLIEEDLIRAGALAQDRPEAETKEPFVDVLVKDGVLQPYRNTIIPGILRDFRHPPGFIKRMNRREDGKEFKSKR